MPCARFLPLIPSLTDRILKDSVRGAAMVILTIVKNAAAAAALENRTWDVVRSQMLRALNGFV